MDLYDDIDTKQRSTQVDGWSSGIKMLQTQLQLKKATNASKESNKKPLMTPVVNLRAKKITEENSGRPREIGTPVRQNTTIINAQPLAVIENVPRNEWDFADEYDPLHPNDYDKLKDKLLGSKDKPRDRDREPERERDRGRKRRGRGSNNNNNTNQNNSHQNNESPPMKFSGFGQRPQTEEDYSPPRAGSGASKSGGAAIAPPPSLQEISIVNDTGDNSSNVTIPYSASSVAAKIMAKYGFRDGQGLGKQEQGMSIALQVEKTSKRGGRIIHEKDVFIPPPSFSPPLSTNSNPDPFLSPAPPVNSADGLEPSITEIMKAPSKVVLLKNMVGPGDVDEELEPEVKDECNTKYGDVISVVIHEVFGTIPEEAVKIYVEFKRLESAIKAVVDLNGRFFGGRQVRAGFYSFDKFKSFQLT